MCKRQSIKFETTKMNSKKKLSAVFFNLRKSRIFALGNLVKFNLWQQQQQQK
jgi:hypothetical protein